MGEGELCPFLCNITIIIIISKRTHEKTLVFSHAHYYTREVMTVEKMKTGFVERIGDTIFVVNAMPAENAKHTQEELVKALIARETMALQEADVA